LETGKISSGSISADETSLMCIFLSITGCRILSASSLSLTH